MADNVVPAPEPKGGFLLNGGLQSRGLGMTSFKHRDYIHAASFVPGARAFSISAEAANKRVEKRRSALAAKGPNAIDSLKTGSGGSYRFPIFKLHMPLSFPSKAQKSAARANLPYRRQKKFIRQRVDAGRFNPSFAATFVRQPAYYLAFNSGGLKSHQRVGLGLLWNPALGPIVQNTNPNTKDGNKQSKRPSWGIARKPFTEPIDGRGIDGRFRVNGKEIDLRSGVHNYGGGNLQVAYPLGKKGQATWSFEPTKIRGAIRLSGNFVHQIPLIPDRNSVDLSAGAAVYRKNGVTLRIRWRPVSKPKWKPERATKTAPKINFLAIPARDSLNITLTFENKD